MAVPPDTANLDMLGFLCCGMQSKQRLEDGRSFVYMITAQAVQFCMSTFCDFMFSEVCTSLLCIVVVMVFLSTDIRSERME